MDSDHETPTCLYLQTVGENFQIKSYLNVLFCCTINVLFLAAPSATVCHTRLENPILEARINSFFLLLIFCKNVHPPGKGTAKCSYPATPGMVLQKLSLSLYYTLRDPLWYEAFWLAVFYVEPLIHLMKLLKIC